MQSRSLRRLITFFKATIVGGVFVLVPLVLIGVVLGKAATFVYEIIHPLMEWFPVKTVGTMSLAFMIAIAAIVFVCFLAGLLARTALSRWFVGSLEQFIMTFVPGYGLMKSMGQGWVGVTSEEPHPPVVVRFDDHSQLGFVMDTLADGKLVVFVPDVPTPWSGQMLFMTPDRVQPLPVSTKQAIECLRLLGANTSKVLSKAVVA